MRERTEKEIAEFFGVEAQDISGRKEYLYMKGSGRPTLMAVCLRIKAFTDVVQAKRTPHRRSANGEGKRPPVLHGRKPSSRRGRA